MLTPDICAAMYECYESMLTAAKENNLDALLVNEGKLAQLRALSAKQGEPQQLSREDVETMRARISRMLELNAQILEYVGPLLDETRTLLSGSVKDRAVKSAYGSADL